MAIATNMLPNANSLILNKVSNASATRTASDVVSMAPVSISITPDVRTTRAVIVHTMIVSANTSKIPQRPCLTGSLTLELLWTITEEPRPASFEKTPLLHPCVMMVLNVIPVTPPHTAGALKAPAKMALNAGMILTALSRMITTDPAMNMTTMTGTIFSATAAIL